MLVVVLLAIVGVVAYYVFSKQKKTTTNSGANGGEVSDNVLDYVNGGDNLTSNTPEGDTSKVNLILYAQNSADSQPRTWAIFKTNPNGNWNADKVRSMQLTSGQTWELTNFPSGTYWFGIQQNGGNGFGQYWGIITVMQGTTVNFSGMDSSKQVQFIVP